ncbi:hypothetical protein JTE90_011342 [Oedothorax gibbosus]|uniref:Uncharacterized protein n=1 Tax=Oedothorax gibbosus TaxID=931172 RepID=A0AAV6VMP0_9ARAC|nr:hypothetical protein JTE90_011342 [Oedothorax gibbosus]
MSPSNQSSRRKASRDNPPSFSVPSSLVEGYLRTIRRRFRFRPLSPKGISGKSAVAFGSVLSRRLVSQANPPSLSVSSSLAGGYLRPIRRRFRFRPLSQRDISGQFAVAFGSVLSRRGLSQANPPSLSVPSSLEERCLMPIRRRFRFRPLSQGGISGQSAVAFGFVLSRRGVSHAYPPSLSVTSFSQRGISGQSAVTFSSVLSRRGVSQGNPPSLSVTSSLAEGHLRPIRRHLQFRPLSQRGISGQSAVAFDSVLSRRGASKENLQMLSVPSPLAGG